MDNLIKEMVLDGVSLIPVRENDKTPFSNWGKEATHDILSLSDAMFKYKTGAVAIRLGERSKGIVCLDVDTKHEKGFDAILFKEIKEYYPHLYRRFRIEQTPSGGYHIFYRVLGVGDWNTIRSRQIASREPNEKEKESRPDIKTYCFLEIKGEGGLTQTTPSPGYVLIKECDFFSRKGKFFGELSIEEHTSLINLCTTFNRLVKKEVAIKTTQTVNDFYSENPYEHFNKSDKGAKILEENGWRIQKTNATHKYFAKPNRKEFDRDIDAGFNFSTGLYTIWSTSTEIEPKSYSPSNLLARIKFNDNKKELYAYLVADGFGKIKPNIEKNIVLNRAKYGGSLPANISPEALASYTEVKEKLQEKYPYGVFWSGEDDGYKINRQEFLDIAHKIGFRYHSNKICYIDGYIIKEVDEWFFFDKMKEYIAIDENIDVFSCYEAFIQNSGSFSSKRLRKIDKEQTLRSSKKLSYKFFNNCYIAIEKDNVEILYYDNLNLLVWEHYIQKRDFTFIDEKEYNDYDKTGKGLYYDFINKAIGIDSYLKTCIGYYAHDYRDEEGYWIIATEQCENPKEGGGAGKNVFCNLMSLTTTYKPVPASMIKKDNNLFQSWDGQRIFCMGDIPKGFDLIFFKDIVTGNAVVNKKYINEYAIDIEDMPKLLGSSNYSFDDTDPGIKRRIRAVEFTDFFTKKKGINKHYGKMFPKSWDDNEYLYFDNFIIKCIQEFLIKNCEIEERELSEGGWIKQFEQKNHHLYEFFNNNIARWIGKNVISRDNFKTEYLNYCIENNINKTYTKTIVRINSALEDYCKHFNIGFKKDFSWKENNVVVWGKEFYKMEGSIIHGEEKIDVPF